MCVIFFNIKNQALYESVPFVVQKRFYYVPGHGDETFQINAFLLLDKVTYCKESQIGLHVKYYKISRSVISAYH